MSNNKKSSSGEAEKLRKENAALKKELDILSKNKSRYKIYFENAGEAIFIMKEMIVIDCNNKAAEILGIDKKDIIGTTPFDTSPEIQPDGIKSLVKGNEILKEYKKNGRITFDWKHNVGKFAEVEVTLRKIYVDGQELMLSMVRDITERKKIENLIKRERDKAKLYLDIAGVVILAINPDETIRMINRKGAALLGYSEEELVGKNWIENFIPKSNRRMVKKVFHQIMSGEVEQQRYVENEIITRSGETKHIAWYNALVYDELENSYITLSSGEDITEKKQAEYAIKESEKNFRLLSENAGLGILIIKEDFHPGYANKKAFEIADVKSGKLSDLSLPNLIVPEEREYVFEQFQRRMHDKDAEPTYEMTIISAKNKRKVIEVNGTRTIWQGRPAVMGIYRDITERKEMERDLSKYQKKLKKMVSELTLAEEKERRRIAVNIHDHLTQSLLMAKVKLKGILEENGTNTEQKKVVSDHISNALVLSRNITHNLSPAILYEMGLGPCIRWRLDQLSEEGYIDFVYEDKTNDLILDNDVKILLYRSVNELLTNIIKHAKATRVKIELLTENKHFILIVEDNGKGFKVDLMDFDHGFGLLSIRERIEYFEGKIDISSAKGKGTRIELRVPIK